METNWGVYALPNGVNLFPIYMTDLDTDYKLNVNVFNCPRKEIARMAYKKEIDTIVDTIKSRAPLIVPWIEEEAEEGYQWEDFCENIMWMWNEYLPVAEELGSDLAENLEHFNTVCGAMRRQQMATWVDLEESSFMMGASTQELRQELASFIDSAIREAEGWQYEPWYVMNWVSEEILALLMASVMRSPLDSLFPLPPASTFIIEIWEAPDDP